MDLEGVGVGLAAVVVVLVETKVALENHKKMETLGVGEGLDRKVDLVGEGVVLVGEDLERSQMEKVAALEEALGPAEEVALVRVEEVEDLDQKGAEVRRQFLNFLLTYCASCKSKILIDQLSICASLEQ